MIGYHSKPHLSKYLSKPSKLTTLVTTILAVSAMQSKLINLSEIINNDVSCENKDHRHRKPCSGNFFVVINPTYGSIYNQIADCCC